jgi:tetratricopeptide (TPR) repeat protein
VIGRRAAIVAGALLVLSSSPALAAPASYASANQSYLNGDWEAAATQYQALVDAGVVNPDLYYNLGNALFRQGRLGPAIYNYERALRIAPGFDDARHNLALARETVDARWDDRVQGASGERGWVEAATYLPVSQLALLFLVVNALFFAALIALRFLAEGPLRIVLKVSASFAGAANLALAVLLVLQIWYLEKVSVGIVLPDEVRMHEGRDETHRERWVIHAGLKVHITGREPGWMRIELANGNEGWVRADAIGEL